MKIAGLIFGLILLALVVLFAVAIVKTAINYVALSRPAIPCPSCGKYIHMIGKKGTCYKCKTPLARTAEGQWTVREK